MAEAADTCGYDMVGIADTPGIAMDPWVATTILAENVRRSRVAVCVTNLVTRHPAIAAASIASIDLLAPGRAVLGIGVGHSGTRNLGAPSLPASELAEGVMFIKELLRARPAPYRGGTAHLPWVKRPSPARGLRSCVAATPRAPARATPRWSPSSACSTTSAAASRSAVPRTSAWRRCGRPRPPACVASCSRSASPSIRSVPYASSARRYCRPCADGLSKRRRTALRRRRAPVVPGRARAGSHGPRRELAPPDAADCARRIDRAVAGGVRRTSTLPPMAQNARSSLDGRAPLDALRRHLFP